MLSLWSFPYTLRYYLTRPWKWLHDFYWNLRNFYHRGRYGFAYVDVWNFCDWYPRVGAAALHYLASHNEGYSTTYNSIDEWRAHIHQLADQLEEVADCSAMTYTDDKNEYYQQFLDLMDAGTTTTKQENGKTVYGFIAPEGFEEVQRQYFEREKELTDGGHIRAIQTYIKLAEDLTSLWD